jgi:hypothetical protein
LSKTEKFTATGKIEGKGSHKGTPEEAEQWLEGQIDNTNLSHEDKAKYKQKVKQLTQDLKEEARRKAKEKESERVSKTASETQTEVIIQDPIEVEVSGGFQVPAGPGSVFLGIVIIIILMVIFA